MRLYCTIVCKLCVKLRNGVEGFVNRILTLKFKCLYSALNNVQNSDTLISPFFNIGDKRHQLLP